MALPQRRAANLPRLLEQRLRLRILPHLFVEQRQIVEALRHIGMPRAENPLAHLQRLEQQRFSGFIIPQVPVHQRQVVERLRHFRALLAQDRLLDGERFLQQRQGGIRIARRIMQASQIAQTRSHRRSLRSQHPPPQLQRLSVERFRRRIASHRKIQPAQVVLHIRVTRVFSFGCRRIRLERLQVIFLRLSVGAALLRSNAQAVCPLRLRGFGLRSATVEAKAHPVGQSSMTFLTLHGAFSSLFSKPLPGLCRTTRRTGLWEIPRRGTVGRTSPHSSRRTSSRRRPPRCSSGKYGCR
ncbi:MAG: hypothetical protein BWY25_01748 [Chloroflexi bacterium ADurb.Bin222]|nr:MAG: hypothetical protein BWY25_01748 [Chloroflexi bacterium ADurb.Bin222]